MARLCRRSSNNSVPTMSGEYHERIPDAHPFGRTRTSCPLSSSSIVVSYLSHIRGTKLATSWPRYATILVLPKIDVVLPK